MKQRRDCYTASSWIRRVAPLLIALPGMVIAAEPGVEFTPMLGYRAGGWFANDRGDTVNLHTKTGLALALDWPATEPGTQYELLYSRQATHTTDGAPVAMKLEYLQLGGTAMIGADDERVMPFAAGGFGATRFSPAGAAFSHETRWSVNLGGGVRVPITPHVRLRFEARGYLTWLNDDSHLFCSAGCNLTAKSKTFFQYEALGGVSLGF